MQRLAKTGLRHLRFARRLSTPAISKFIVNARIGRGMLMTPEARIPFYGIFKNRRKGLFATKPKVFTA